MEPKLLERKKITTIHKNRGAKRIKRSRHFSVLINTNAYLIQAGQIPHHSKPAEAAPQNEPEDHNTKLQPSGLLDDTKYQAGNWLKENINDAPKSPCLLERYNYKPYPTDEHYQAAQPC